VKTVAEMFYKIFEESESKEKVEQPQEFENLEQQFVQNLSKDQRNMFLDLEIFYMEIVKNHSILLIEFLLKILMNEAY